LQDRMVAGFGCNEELDLASAHRSEIRFELSNELLKFLIVASASLA